MPRLASKVLAQWTPSPSTFQVVCAHCTCPGVLTLQQIHMVVIFSGFAFSNIRNRHRIMSHTQDYDGPRAENHHQWGAVDQSVGP
jgi:hypothetical protein